MQKTGDPVLDAHKGAERVYLLSHPLKPISIRDQLIRSCLLVDRLCTHRYIPVPDSTEKVCEVQTEGRPVLILGVGVAGINAALRLVIEHNVSVHLIDKGDGRLFKLQANAPSRWVDPCQYDWPAAHWDKAAFPITKAYCTMPLEWDADKASLLAKRWRKILLNNAGRNMITITPYCKVNGGKVVGSVIKVTLESTKSTDQKSRAPLLLTQCLEGKEIREYQAVILATGFGVETTSLRKDINNKDLLISPGKGFWQKDRLEKPMCGLKPPAGRKEGPVVCIAGSGDGALQDFIRVVTKKKSARDVLEYVFAGIPEVLQEVEKEIREVEEFAIRHGAWNFSREHDECLFIHTHEGHQAVVDKILQGPEAQNILIKLNQLLNQSDSSEVHLVYPKQYFSCFYALNRFIVLLLGACISTRSPKKAYLHGEHVIGECKPIQNSKDWPEYRVGIYDLAGALADDPAPVRTLAANVVVVRIGIRAEPAVGNLSFEDPQRPRHIFPHYILHRRSAASAAPSGL
ncbi:MAG: hypothetical protein ACAI35_00915 [Candidatus Methylacidiphilales bacterium]|nr:hypothetical protein [Candidatus Methylacidiphilales bacterium]